jgi:hypothetical protein
MDFDVPYFPVDNVCVIYTKTFSKLKKKSAHYTMNACYAIKIEEISNHLHTYVHNNLKQRILRK